jgi:hypothetical protein
VRITQTACLFSFFLSFFLSFFPFFFPLWLHGPLGLALASFSGFLNHTYRHTVGLLWTSDQPVAETSTYTGQHNI